MQIYRLRSFKKPHPGKVSVLVRCVWNKQKGESLLLALAQDLALRLSSSLSLVLSVTALSLPLSLGTGLLRFFFRLLFLFHFPIFFYYSIYTWRLLPRVWVLLCAWEWLRAADISHLLGLVVAFVAFSCSCWPSFFYQELRWQPLKKATRATNTRGGFIREYSFLK